MKFTLLTGVSVSLLISGCASIISGTSQNVVIDSSPSQAAFTIANQAGMKVHSGVTPSTVNLKSGAGYFDGEMYSITYQKEGYLDSQAAIDSSINGWYFGNFLFGGLLGLLIIDPATGAMYDLPEQVSTNLAPTSKAMSVVPQKNTVINVQAPKIQQQPSDNKNLEEPDKTLFMSNSPESLINSLDYIKYKCRELGFKPKTPKFGNCVLALSK